MEIEEIIKKAKQIIGSISIQILKGEDKILNELNNIENNTNEENKLYHEKMLLYIESYFDIKEKSTILEEDYKFLHNLAKNLREQNVRKTDISNPPLFKLRKKDGRSLFFISRNALNEYIKFNDINDKEIESMVEIPINDSIELEMLLAIIKRNF